MGPGAQGQPALRQPDKRARSRLPEHYSYSQGLVGRQVITKPHAVARLSRSAGPVDFWAVAIMSFRCVWVCCSRGGVVSTT